MVGQGGLVTTVEELQRWDENFYTGRVGGKSFLARQLEQGKLNNGTLLPYAFGLQVGKYRGLATVDHAGSTGGYRTDLIRFPSVHTSVATLCNVATADAPGMALRVADVVLASAFTEGPPQAGARAAAAQQASSIVLPEAEIAALIGRYYSEELNVTYDLARTGNTIVLRRPRAAVETLVASDAKTLLGRGLTIRIVAPGTFTLDNGRARGMVFTRASR
jgi:hypothetical protein